MGIEGAASGMILALPCIVTAVAIPAIPSYFKWAGVENSILQGNLGYALAMLGLGFGLAATNKTMFLTLTLLASILFGLTFAANICVESVLVLKYSAKQDREKSLGFIKAATGLGGFFCPFLVTTSLLIWGYFFAFLFVSLAFVVTAPFVYRQLAFSRDKFREEAKALAERETSADPEMRSLLNKDVS